jgi:hypothetical protein
MTDNKNELIFNAYIDLEGLVQEYKHAVLWLTQGNHKATPHPSIQETREIMRDLKGKITTRFCRKFPFENQIEYDLPLSPTTTQGRERPW